jgi:hypothetical protein
MNNQHILVTAIMVAACGSGSSGEFEDIAETMQGIYRVTSYTHNSEACAPGGESRLGEDRFALAISRTVIGIPLLEIVSCESVADCRDKAAQLTAKQPYVFEFGFTASKLGPDGALLGQGGSSGFHIDGVCTLGEVTRSTFALAGDALRVEMEITIADDYAPPAPNTCTTREAERAAAGNACSEMEVLVAELVEPL